MNSPTVGTAWDIRKILVLGRDWIAALFLIAAVVTCTPPERRAYAQFVASSKNAMQPRVLYTAATNILTGAVVGRGIEVSDLPRELTNFPAGPPTDAFVGKWEGTPEKGLMLIWGNGFAHWGVIIGEQRFGAPRVDYLEISEWSNHVFFFYQRR
jgi:hypothetical protein